MERTNENIVSSFFFYMWNGWGTEEECRQVFDWNYNHFWDKWCAIFKENKRGAAEIFYSELSPDNRRKLIERACEMYDGDRRKPQPNDEPIFWTNNVNKAALERHGYDAADVTDDALIEIAGIMGDLYANSRYSEDLIAACDEVGIPKIQ